MKNKKVQILLLLAVVGIWSVLLLRIIRPAKVNVPVLAETKAAQVMSETDSVYQLIGNYRDPFSNARSKSSSSSKRTKQSQSKDNRRPSASTVQPLNWPNLEFRGIVRNIRTGSVSAIIVMDAKESILDPGEELGELLLVSVNDTAALIRMGAEEKAFAIAND